MGSAGAIVPVDCEVAELFIGAAIPLDDDKAASAESNSISCWIQLIYVFTKLFADSILLVVEIQKKYIWIRRRFSLGGNAQYVEPAAPCQMWGIVIGGYNRQAIWNGRQGRPDYLSIAYLVAIRR